MALPFAVTALSAVLVVQPNQPMAGQPTAPSILWQRNELSPRFPVRYVDGRPVVVNVLQDIVVDAGDSYAIVDTMPYVVRRSAHALGTRWKDRDVTLYNADGTTCAAKATGLAAYGWFEWFDETQADNPDDEPVHVPTAAMLWQLADDQAATTMAVELADDRCQDAILAQWTDETPVDTLVASPADATPEQRVIIAAALRALPQFERIQNRFIRERRHASDEYGEPTVGAETAWDASPTLSHVLLGQRTFFSARMHAEGGCGEFAADLFAVWELVIDGGEDRIELRYVSTDGDAPVLWFGSPANAEATMEDDRPFEVPTNVAYGCGC